ncbi:hypothetical protein FJTKL_00646 [Diaporthe vaccinii]|uniref:Uncharacterized protein n=1 Tax=Diaporthe vaccinii TaxID=105482 RepID=A0ABR4F637_9PEZI
MDAASAYNQHSSQGRRKNRSSTNLNHLSLAPLTTKLPINDTEIMFTELNIHTYSTSYIQGKSAPTTPSLLSRSPRRANSRTRHHSRQGSATPLPKSNGAGQEKKSPCLPAAGPTATGSSAPGC